MSYNFLVPVSKGLLKEELSVHPGLWAHQFSFLTQASCEATWPDEDLWASVPTSVKHYSTQMCELATFEMVTYSDIPLMEAIFCIFVFSSLWFSFFKVCCHFIFYFYYLTDVEGNLTGLSVSTNAIYQAAEITLQGLFSELHWINNTRLFKHTCLLPTWSKWFDYLFTEIMTQGADYGFNFIWLMDLDFSCTLSIYAYPPTVQLPRWYAFFCACVSHLKSGDDIVE